MRFHLWFSLLATLVVAATAGAVEMRDEVYRTKDAGTVTFSHKRHMGTKLVNNDCKSCHNTLYSMKKRQHHTMAQMEQGKSCGACHDGKKVFSVRDCGRCHAVKEMTYNVKETGPTKFSHNRHLRKYGCDACHPKLLKAGKNPRYTMAQMEQGKSCGACHNAKEAFALERCTACHPVREITYKVKETGPLTFSHKAHITRNRCEQCHPRVYSTGGKNPRTSMAAMEKGKSCGACHDGKKAFATGDCTKCHPVRDIEFPVANGWNATFGHTVHTSKYRCEYCHPKLFRPGPDNRSWSMADMAEGHSCGACHDGKKAFSVTETCVQCHPGKRK